MTEGRIVKRGRETWRDCTPYAAIGPHRLGDVWECECGRRWRYVSRSRGWRMTLPSMFGLRRRRSHG